MPWKESCVMDERMGFIVDQGSDEWTMSELCERYEISRKTGYKWLERYREGGVAGLVDRSRAPLHRPQAMSAEIAEFCLAVRREHPTWGPIKVKAWLERRRPRIEWPAASTIAVVASRVPATPARMRIPICG